jgi:hypothetical protein
MLENKKQALEKSKKHGMNPRKRKNSEKIPSIYPNPFILIYL